MKNYSAMISSFYEKIIGSSPVKNNQQKILCVGLTCLDIIQTCNSFPIEDSDTRCVDYRWQRGGNASNNCTVLSKLGTQVEFLGTLGAGNHSKFIRDDMIKHGIDYSHCPVIEGVDIPTSTVILNLQTGSRTILHYNPNLPELTVEDFEKLNLSDYSWVHFEGRNIPRVLGMMQVIENYNDKIKLTKPDHLPITISVELEKTHVELLDLLPYADVAFISKDFACSRGFNNMSETIRNIARDVKSGATIICAWGDRGAMARTPNGTIVQSPAFPPPQIVDSLGAGDTFTAAILHCLNFVKLRDHSKKIDQKKQDNENNKNMVTDENREMNKNENIVGDNEIVEASQKSLIEKQTRIEHNYNIESLEYSETDFINNSVLHAAVTFACRTAGAKIGFKGYEGFQRICLDFLDDL
ncbi:ketohexokinase-like [Chelonus insularis]|uniref:ketohexokinase-like n=1 Tax=Chelonus insularis TaxID=460826 RepID=UPI00158888FE|nr:ketohexokinase-like [Chelonus insularis]XP_034943317.1 ketohexokinase-like [Chelonus insularis]XP_034943318.1 ketohexokinase-like [Chelonus insularis]